MAVNELLYNSKTFERLRKASCNLSESLSLSALPIDTLSATVVEETDVADLKEYEYGSIVQYKHNNILIGKFYLEKIEQTGKWDWTFSCISPIGLLEKDNHWGGIYTGQTAEEVLADVIGGVIPYTIDDGLKTVLVYGWLPKGTRRDNLRNVLFAINARVIKNDAGDCHFVALSEGEPYELPISKFYLTGGSVTKGSPATQAQITEHSYYQSPGATTETIFEGVATGSSFITPKGTSISQATLLEWDKPYYDYQVTGSTILESGVNYVVVSQSANCTITAKAYAHSERVLFRNGEENESPNVVNSNACHLVNLTNSELVADRVIAFYGHAKKTVVDIILTTQKPGDYITYTTPYGEELTGFIESLDITFSKEMKARATLISGYSPPVVQTFDNRVVLTGSGQWQVPDGIRKIRYALFQGATGGGPGVKGGDASGSTTHNYEYTSWISGKVTNRSRHVLWGGPGGVGGPGGPGGSGSRIKEGEMDVTPGALLDYSCGVGGTGAPFGTPTGTEGSVTTLNGVNSSDGTFPAISGWVDVLTGDVYALPGDAGLPGGNGAGGRDDYTIPDTNDLEEIMGGYVSQTGAYDEDGKLWPGAPTKLGRTGYPNHANLPWAPQYYSANSAGTRGCGAGYALGPGGVAGVTQAEPGRNGASQSQSAGYAADGMTPPAPSISPKKPGVTKGGRGGYGGGGGSCPGWAGGECDPSEGASLPSVVAGTPGTGGPGGVGGPGGDGMIIIYY